MFEFPGIESHSTHYTLWSALPHVRMELAKAGTLDRVAFGYSVLIEDHSAGRKLSKVRDDLWVEEDFEPVSAWHPVSPLMGQLVKPVFTGLRVEEREDRRVGIVEGCGSMGAMGSSMIAFGMTCNLVMWVDLEDLVVLRTELSMDGLRYVDETLTFRLQVDIPPQRFVVPPKAEVVISTPICPEATAIMEGARAAHAELDSFFVRKVCGAEGWLEEHVRLWYADPYLRTEVSPVSPARVPVELPTRVTIAEFAEGAVYAHHEGIWEKYTWNALPGPNRRIAALGWGLGLNLAHRFTTVEEDEMDGKFVWRVTGELPIWDEAVADVRPQWWIDRETYHVVQYEERIGIIEEGHTEYRMKTCRIEEFLWDVEIPEDKFQVPDDIDLVD